MNWIEKALSKLKPKEREKLHRNEFIVPNGRATFKDKCHVCGRLPHPYEEPFMIYGEPVCEDCFWDVDDLYPSAGGKQ